MRLLGPVMVALVFALASPALAQSPMSPIYPTAPANSRQPSAPKEITFAPEPAKAARTTERSKAEEEAPATTVIQPPPLEPPPVATAEPSRPESVTAPEPAPKWRKRAARRSRYARRSYAPYHAGWYYSSGTAHVTGWDGGQFGPSPYSSTGQ